MTMTCIGQGVEMFKKKLALYFGNVGNVTFLLAAPHRYQVASSLVVVTAARLVHSFYKRNAY